MNFPNRGFYRGNLAAMVADAKAAFEQLTPEQRAESRARDNDAEESKHRETFTQREAARDAGYTGDQCSTCNSMRMKISGHCLVCEDCGTTTGCS